MKRYDSYKDSGVEWIGKIPFHWNYGKLKNVGCLIAGGTPSTDKEEYWGGDIPWLQSGKIQYKIIEIDDVDKYITKLGFVKSSTKLVNPNSVLVAITGATCGNIGYLKFPSTINQSIIGIEFNSSNSSLYFFYYLFIQREQIRFNITGGAQGGVTKTDISNLFIPLPPLSEQQQIVSFLDTKTSLIDSLIEKTQRKIELLKEKRTSLINEVVTKGLNPNVEMKDSGVEWIGKIPSHWDIKRIKHLRSKDKYSLVDGPFGSNLKSIHYVENGDVYIIESGFITSGKFRFVREFKTITSEHFETIKRSECNEGDIIISKIGEYYGMSGILPKLDKRTVISGNSISLTLNSEMNNQFVHQIILQHRINGTFKKEVQQTGQPFISLGVVDNLTIPTPPLFEQHEIVEYLNEQTQLIDKTISIEEKRIELLKEYRQSLISEVVTGKLKVTTDE